MDPPVSSFGMKMRIGLVLLCYLASANCLPNGETFASKAESYLGNCLVLSVIKFDYHTGMETESPLSYVLTYVKVHKRDNFFGSDFEFFTIL